MVTWYFNIEEVNPITDEARQEVADALYNLLECSITPENHSKAVTSVNQPGSLSS